MKKLKYLSYLILVLCLLHWSTAPCNGQDEGVAAPMMTSEQEALYSAIQGFVGRWWNGSDLYPDPCGWTPIQGVSCDLFDGFWYVTDLSIGRVHDNSLNCAQNVEFSPSLFALRHLKSLSFYNCFVSPGHHPVSIPTQNWEVFGPTLESLEFRSNAGLTGQLPLIFGELRNLQSLVITENGLTGPLPESIGNLIRLRRLNLAGNSFSGRIPDTIGGLNHLLILDISRNSLTGTLPVTLGGLTSLLKLDLSNNGLEGGIPLEFSNLKNLTLLDLSKNRLSGGLTKSLEGLNSLQELVLSDNPTGGDLVSVEWRNLMGLTALDLSNMSLTGGIPESITELKGLRFLGLNDNKLTGNISPNLATLPNVSAFYIHGNNLTGELKFSEWFYGKMRRRFGAWGNPYLCYPIRPGPSSYIPVGVKQCREEDGKFDTHIDSKSKLGSGDWNVESDSVASLGFKETSVGRLVLVVEEVMVLVFMLFL